MPKFILKFHLDMALTLLSEASAIGIESYSGKKYYEHLITFDF